MFRSKEDRRKEALARQAAYAKLTAAQKIAKLDKKLGVDIGAVKERQRLILA